MLKRKQQKNTFLQFNLNLQSYLREFVGEEGRIFLMYSIDIKDTWMFIFDVDLMMIIMMMKTYYVYSMFYFILFLCTQRGTMLNILARTNIVFNKCVF
jgi:hypothetical protein